MSTSEQLRARRKARLRRKIRENANGKPRLSVHRTAQHIYAQIIDDTKACTIASASSLVKELADLKSGSTVEAATQVGKLIAQNAIKAGVEEVVFDRSGFLYHGRIKALADSARENGLKF